VVGSGAGRVEAVIFDYGGVISTRLFDDLWPFEEEMGLPRGSVYRLMFSDLDAGDDGGDAVDGAHDGAAGDHPVHDFHRLETGDITLDVYIAGLVQRAPEVLGRPLDLNAYWQYAARLPLLVQWPVVHRIRRLRDDGMALALLTNNVKEFGSAWRAAFPVDELFRVVVDSSEVGLRKPDPRIYELTCERLGVAPASAVFLDDNRDNVGAATALGIESVLVGPDPRTTIRDLDAILDRRG
jgi:putative hydrolase of the HAD superfamily